MNTTEEIRSQVLKAVPAEHIAYRALLSLVRVEMTTATETAAVSMRGRPRLLINPQFVRRHCRTPEHLSMLVMHELYHLLLGHTRIFERTDKVSNIAFDAVVNVMLCREFPEPRYTSFFSRFYRSDRAPEALLRPPKGWRTPQVTWQLGGSLGEVHRAMYAGRWANYTYKELFGLLQSELARVRAHPQGRARWIARRGVPRLLGNHRRGDARTAPWGGGSSLVDEARRIARRWSFGGHGDAPAWEGAFGKLELSVAHVSRHVKAVLRRALLEVAARISGQHSRGEANYSVQTLLPFQAVPDRRSTALEEAGLPPLLYPGPIHVPRSRHSDEVHIYLDASGSVAFLLPELYDVVLEAEGLVRDRIFLFSTQVKAVTFHQLRTGEVWTTAGTDIGCVTEHVIRHRVQRAVVITDGHVGAVPSRHVPALRNLRLGAVVLEHGDAGFAASFPGARTYRLPSLFPLAPAWRRRKTRRPRTASP